MSKNINIVQDTENMISVEILAKSILDISLGIEKLRSGPINDKGLFLLIQHAIPQPGYGKSRVGIAEIRSVFDGIASLKDKYLKKNKS